MLACALTEARSNPSLETVLAAYIQAEESGQSPDQGEWLARYPDLAEDLQAFFDSREVVPRLWPDRTELQTPCRFGEYELLEEIAHGGMGIVYKARQLRPNRIVALKLILAGQLARRSDVERFHAEAEAAASLDHPHIVPIYEVGQHAGQHYFTMKFIDGGSLAERNSEFRNLNSEFSSAARLLSTVARAVHYAHQRGILHRDLKPSNVLLDAQGQPYVTDFGLAKRVQADDSLTCSGAIVGTPLYMAPEQAAGQTRLTTAADIYSLGAILYWLLTGQPAIQASSTLELLKQLQVQEPLPPRSLNPVLDRDLETICLKCLEKDPSRRYESAAALADDLDRWLAGDPILARPASALEKAIRRCRKNPLVSVLAASLVAVALLGFIGILGQWQSALASEQRAVANEQKATLSAAAAQVSAQEAKAKAKEASAQRDEAQKQRDEVKHLADRLQRTLYAAHMNLAHGAWDAGNIVRMRDLLNQHRPKPDESDLRGFEWHYLIRMCHAELLTIETNTGGVVFSPDGKRFASGGGGGGRRNFEGRPAELKVWDAQTGKELLSITLEKSKSRVDGKAFSPDGKRLAAGVGFWEGDPQAWNWVSGEVKVWDAQSGQELLSMKSHAGYMTDVAYSPDGKLLASVGGRWDNQLQKTLPTDVKLWDAQTGQELRSFPVKEHTGAINCISFSPDGARFATGADDETVRVWESRTGEELLSFKEHVTEVMSVSFSPDGKRIISCDHAGPAKIWDAQSGSQLLALTGHTGGVYHAAFSPNGKRAVTAGADRSVTVWDAQSGARLFTFKGHSNMVRSVAFSPDGTRLASSGDETIRVWDAASGPEFRRFPTFDDHISRFRDARISPNVKNVVGFGVWDGEKQNADMLKVFDAQTNRDVQIFAGHRGVFDPDGIRLAVASDDGKVTIWNSKTGRELIAFQAHSSPISGLDFSPDGTRLATASNDKTVKTWDVATGRELTSLAHTREVRSVLFSPNGQQLISMDRFRQLESTLRLWDAVTGRELVNFMRAYGATFSSDGKRLASASPEECKIWNAETGQELLSLPGTGTPLTFGPAFSPDASRVAFSKNTSNGGLGEVQVWDAQTGKEVFTLSGHTATVSSVVFSPDGKRLASAAGSPVGAQGGEVKIWDAHTGQELLTIKGGGFGHRITFSTDGHRLASIFGGVARIYDATPLPE